MEQALSDVTVLDLSLGVAGPFCTKVMACLGAEVIKIEPPDGGDPTRHLGPFLRDDPNPEASGLFLHLNTGKKSVTLDVATPTGAAIARRLAATADIVVESWADPGSAQRLGLGYGALELLNPRLVYTSVTDFGRTGPYASYLATDIILYAMGGEMCSTGRPEGTPVRLAEDVMAYQAGNAAAAVTLMALYGARQTGQGQQIDISAFETAVSSVDRRIQYLMSYIYTGKVTTRADNEWSIYPVGIYPCKDGFFDVYGGGPGNFPRVCNMIGMPELLRDPRFSHPMDLIDPQRKDEFDAIFLPWVIDRTRDECMAAARAAKVYAAPICTPGDVFKDPHFAFREYFADVEHSVTGHLLYPGAPGKMSETPWQTRPAPLLGQHNLEVLGERLGYDRDDLVGLRRAGVI